MAYLNSIFTTFSEELFEIIIYDMQGKTCFNKNILSAIGKNELPFELNNFNAGLYIVEIRNNTKVDFIKMIISQ